VGLPLKEVAVHLSIQTAMRKVVRSGEVAVCPLRCTATSPLRTTFLMADSNLYECQPPLFSWLSVHSDVQPPLSSLPSVVGDSSHLFSTLVFSLKR
jgi:hypothetical protein